MKARIYHNPRCSKSRRTLELLQERGVDVEIIEYLRNPPTENELAGLLRKLELPASEIVRQEEPEYRATAAENRADDRLLALVAQQPQLLQRPIVVVGDRARIGRPPERVLELLE